MQAIRQSFINVIQRSGTLGVRSTSLVQQMRCDGSDPRSSTSSENHQDRRGSGSGLNKSKGSEKKQQSTKTDDTDQPGAKRGDWSDPTKLVGNDPSYGKAGSTTNLHNPDEGKN